MANYAGFTTTSHTDVYYNRIWLLPTSLDFTGIPAGTPFTASIWNAYTVQKTLNNLFPTQGIINIGFSPFSGGVYSPLKLNTYSVTNNSNSPNYFNGTCLFDFTDAEDVTLSIHGEGFESFIYDNNWNTQVTEYYSYLTDIKTFNNGKEQRSRRRQYPRRGLTYRINPANYFNESGARSISKRIENHLTYIYGYSTLVPIWQDLYRSTTAINANSTSITGSFSNLDFQAGNFCLLFQNISTYEIVKLNTVNSTTLTFTSGVINRWGIGTKIVPLRKAIFGDDSIANNYEVSFLADLTPKFSILAEELDTSLRNTVYIPNGTYRSKDVVILENNFTESQSVTITQNSRILDFEHTIFAPDRAWQKDKKSFSINKLIQNRADFSNTIGLFKHMSGAWKSFWLINKSCEMDITDTVGVDSPGFWIKDIGITRYRNVQINPTHIYGIGYDNSLFMRRIVTSSLDSNNREFLSIDAPTDRVISPNTFKALGFVYLMRFGSDDLEITWESDTVATTNLNFIEVFDEL